MEKVTINKKFTIKDSKYIISGDMLDFINSFYSLLISDGILKDPKVQPKDYLETLKTMKVPHHLSGNILVNEMKQVSETCYDWVGVFSSSSAYDEYKNDLMTIFGTDFNSSVDTKNVSLEITIS